MNTVLDKQIFRSP